MALHGMCVIISNFLEIICKGQCLCTGFHSDARLIRTDLISLLYETWIPNCESVITTQIRFLTINAQIINIIKCMLIKHVLFLIVESMVTYMYSTSEPYMKDKCQNATYSYATQ